MLLTVFLPGDNNLNVTNVREQLATLKLGQITKTDMRNLMINPYMEHFNGLVDYMRQEVVSDVTHKKGMTSSEVLTLVEEVACRCLEIGCKVCPEQNYMRFYRLMGVYQGRMLQRVCDTYPSARKAIAKAVSEIHQVDVDDVSKDRKYKLCRPWYRGSEDNDFFWDGLPSRTEGADYLSKAPSNQFLVRWFSFTQWQIVHIASGCYWTGILVRNDSSRRNCSYEGAEKDVP